MEDTIAEAFKEIYGKPPTYETSIRYSNRFKPYNACVSLRGNKLEFKLSKKWKSISDDIKIGLIQELMLKIFREKIRPLKTKTQRMELYNIFIKKIHIAIPKTKIDVTLKDSFDRVNKKYFYGLMETPNLVWGNYSTSKLGSYEYGSDTITISKVLRDAEQELLDYVMYHEMLHKKYKFKRVGNRCYHHTKKFKIEERSFENSKRIEKKLKKLARKKRFEILFGFNQKF